MTYVLLIPHCMQLLVNVTDNTVFISHQDFLSFASP